MRASVRSIRWLMGASLLAVTSGVVCLADDVRPLPAGATVTRPAELARYLTQEPVREDLKLTAEQRERIDRWRQELDVARKSTPRPPAHEFLIRAAEES